MHKIVLKHFEQKFSELEDSITIEKFRENTIPKNQLTNCNNSDILLKNNYGNGMLFSCVLTLSICFFTSYHNAILWTLSLKDITFPCKR